LVMVEIHEKSDFAISVHILPEVTVSAHVTIGDTQA
jgi:hypothetical protein